MRAIAVIYIFLSVRILTAQSIPAYYNNVNLNLTGIPLKTELSQKIINTHTNSLSYSDVWNVLKEADLSPSNNQNVWLIYGWNDDINDITNDLNRDKNDNGGNVGQWNREHVFPKSLGSPDLGTSGPGSDAHNLRACDVQRNGSRGNKKFGAGTGINSGAVSFYWFPGDNWKGDVARVIMYMYLRYSNQCKPSAVTVGNPVGIDLNMVDLLLAWNAADPPDDFENNRNDIIFQNQGNRNPFIDNPYLATLIWGGTPALNRWNLGIKENASKIKIYPNPSYNGTVIIKQSSTIKKISVYTSQGQELTNYDLIKSTDQFELKGLKSGFYIIKLNTKNGVLTRKITVL